jgi:hypothetical protein
MKLALPRYCDQRRHRQLPAPIQPAALGAALPIQDRDTSPRGSPLRQIDELDEGYLNGANRVGLLSDGPPHGGPDANSPMRRVAVRRGGSHGG